MVSGKNTWKQFRRAAKTAWVQVGVVQKGYYHATARNLDYESLARKIEADHLGLRKTFVRAAMLTDVTSFAEAVARTFISHPKSAGQDRQGL